MRIPYFFVIIYFVSSSAHAKYQKPFVIVTASYNNKEWYQRNLDSIFNQNYEHWRLIYIDDCSTDGTADLVQQYIADRGMKDKVTLIKNKQRMRHLFNQYHAIHSCKNHEIIVIVDGDDWFFSNDVLNRLDSVYQNPNVWLTYGQFKPFKGKYTGWCKPLPSKNVLNNTIRSLPFEYVSHLRTFYAALFKKIIKNDLMHEGTFFPMSADIATIFPMIEMAQSHVKFIPHVLLVYNDANNLNIRKTNCKLQLSYANIIRNKKPYEPIKRLAIDSQLHDEKHSTHNNQFRSETHNFFLWFLSFFSQTNY